MTLLGKIAQLKFVRLFSQKIGSPRNKCIHTDIVLQKMGQGHDSYSQKLEEGRRGVGILNEIK